MAEGRARRRGPGRGRRPSNSWRTAGNRGRGIEVARLNLLPNCARCLADNATDIPDLLANHLADSKERINGRRQRTAVG
eukprot:1159431-Lingulodinium_polyedra.AAC.1